MSAAWMWGWIFLVFAVLVLLSALRFNYVVLLKNGTPQDRIPLWFPLLFLGVAVWILLTNAFYGY